MGNEVFAFLFKLSTGYKIFKFFRNRYDEWTIAKLNETVKSHNKIQAICQNSAFLRQCLENNVAPSFIKAKLKRSKVHNSLKMEKAFLNDELGKNNELLCRLRETFNKQRNKLRIRLSNLDFVRFLMYLQTLRNKKSANYFKKMDKTLSFLKEMRFGKRVSTTPKCITNLSRYKLSPREESVLSLGLRFCVPPSHINREEVFAEFEGLLGQLDHSTPNSQVAYQRMKASLVDLAHGYCGSNIDVPDRQASNELVKIYLKLKENNNLVTS